MKALLLVALCLVACGGGESAVLGVVGDGGVLTDVAPAPVIAYSFHYGPQMILPGQEGVACLDFAGPDHDVWARGWHVKSSLVHHVNIWRRTSGTPYTMPTNCAAEIASVATGVFGATQPDVVELLDEAPEYRGAYIRLQAGTKLVWDVHYLNVGGQPAPATIDIDFYEAEERTIAVGGFSLSAARGLSVPPGVTETLAYTCPSPAAELSILSITAHVHAHNIGTHVAVNGQEIYYSKDWASPLVKPFDSLHGGRLTIKPTDKVTWSCEIANTTSSSLRWANSVNTGEMCIVFGYTVGPGWSCLL